MQSLNAYMHKRGLSEYLVTRVRKFYEYQYEERNEDFQEGSAIIQGLTTSLKEEVYRDIYGQILRTKRLFEQLFSKQCIDELAL
jgi:lysine/ornithine N-monooxygenase